MTRTPSSALLFHKRKEAKWYHWCQILLLISDSNVIKMVLTIQTFLTEVDRSCTCILISYLENSCPEADFDYALKTGPAEAYPVLAESIYTKVREENWILHRNLLKFLTASRTQMQHVFKPQTLACFWATYHFQMEFMNKSDRNKLRETGN